MPSEYDQDVTKLYIVHGGPNQATVVFDPEAKRYKCCCNQMHVRTASMLVALVEVVAVLICLISVTINYYKLGNNYSTQFAVGIAFVVLYSIVVSLFFCAICSQSATFVVAHLLIQLVTMTLFVAIIILIIIQWVNGDTVSLRQWAGQGQELPIDVGLSYLTITITLISTCAIAFIVYAWFVWVVFRCYRYFADRKKFRDYIAASQVVRVPFSNASKLNDA